MKSKRTFFGTILVYRGRIWGVLADCNWDFAVLVRYLLGHGKGSWIVDYGVGEFGQNALKLSLPTWSWRRATMLPESEWGFNVGDFILKNVFESFPGFTKKGWARPGWPQNVIRCLDLLTRCLGTLEQLNSRQALCLSVLFDYQQTQQKLLFNRKHRSTRRRTKRKTRNSQRMAMMQSARPRKSGKNRKLKPVKDKLARDAVTVFFSNLSFDVTEEDITVGFPELTIKSIDWWRVRAGRVGDLRMWRWTVR
jgi:hypothetical protein